MTIPMGEGPVPIRSIIHRLEGGASVTDEAVDAQPRVPKAADLVARRLRSEIVRGEVPVGEQLASEATLMERFGVSRPTLRAALHILETEELVEVRRGSRGGVWVRSPSNDVMGRRAGAYLQHNGVTLDDVHRARGLVEPPAVAILAERRDAADIARLEALLAEEAEALDDRAAVRAAGERFHVELVELAGNQTLTVFSSMLQEIIDAQTARFQADQAERGSERHSAGMHKEHEHVLDLIKAGKATDAELYWRTHLDRVRSVIASGPAETVLDLMP
jgi:DNA-binding FadR family transcriptional regulator